MPDNFFEEISNFIAKFCLDNMNGITENLIDNVETAVFSFLVIYFIWFGIKLIMGQTRSFSYDLLIAVATCFLVLLLSLNLGEYNKLITENLIDLPEELAKEIFKNKLGISPNIPKYLDGYSTDILQGINKLTDNASYSNQVGVALVSLFAATLMYCFWILMSVTVFFNIIAIKIFSSFLIAIGPLIILTTLFKSTRHVFSRWLSLILSYTVFSLFITVILFVTHKTSIHFFQEFKGKADNINFGDLAPSILWMLLITLLVWSSAKITFNLFSNLGDSFGNIISDRAFRSQSLLFGGNQNGIAYYGQGLNSNVKIDNSIRKDKVINKNIITRNL